MSTHPSDPRRSRGSRLAAALLLALLACLALAAGAQASAFSSTFADYKAHGKVDPCQHSAADLKQAKSQVPPDIQQYAPDFPASLDAALEARARGQCGPGGTAAGGGSATAAGGGSATAAGAGAAGSGTPGSPGSGAGGAPGAGGANGAAINAAGAPGAPTTVAPAGSGPGAINARRAAQEGGASQAPAPLIAIALLLLLLIVAALLWALARLTGWEPGWMAAARHSLAEAGHRSGATWSEFTDWVRLGH